MKKFLFTIAALALGLQMNAQTISFGPLNDEGYIEVPQGGQATVAVQYTKNSETIIKGYKFTLTFTDEFVNTVKDSKELPIFTIDPDNDYFALQRTKNNGFSALPSSEDANLKGTAGNFGTLQFQATADAEIGSTHEVKVSNAGFSVEDESGALRTVMMEDFSFSVKIIENRITFDELATELPEETGLQNVLVKRTIKANQWNTICLPFAMTAEQVAKAFGEAQLADFTGCTAEYPEGADYATSIKVNFQTVTEMAANRPYLIKVTNPVTYADGFKVDGVTIEPSESLVNEQDEDFYKKNGKIYYTYNSFIGTYVANTEIPAGSIILSGNKFYYTKGTTTKGFRGWFYFENCSLDDINLATAEVKIFIDDATAIDGIGIQRIVDGVYDLSGRKIQIEGNDLNKLQKGVYIIDGKKVTIK